MKIPEKKDILAFIRRGIPEKVAIGHLVPYFPIEKIQKKYAQYSFLYGCEDDGGMIIESRKKEIVARLEPTIKKNNSLYVKWFGKEVPYVTVYDSILGVFHAMGVPITHEDVYACVEKKEEKKEFENMTSSEVAAILGVKKIAVGARLRGMGYKLVEKRILGVKKWVWVFDAPNTTSKYDE